MKQFLKAKERETLVEAHQAERNIYGRFTRQDSLSSPYAPDLNLIEWLWKFFHKMIRERISQT